MIPLNLFYQEPDPDRWFPYDRYPRKIIRRILRGKQRPGGVMQIALSLMQGLDRLGIPYRFNDFNYIDQHPEEIACIIGKPQVFFGRSWKNPVIFGAGIYSHPIVCPDLFEKYPQVKRFLVPGEWMKDMCRPYYGDRVLVWPAGIDTQLWHTNLSDCREFDFLIYDKRGWTDLVTEENFINPIVRVLEEKGLSYQFIRYGSYTQAELKTRLGNSRAVIFLCTHETQGQAYQQILSTNTPILAWDRGGFWQDPAYYPHQVQYGPVSSVPYWDDRCGCKFSGLEDFPLQLATFLGRFKEFSPRQYILENLTLEKSAAMYLDIVVSVRKQLEND
ncbi:hypothetical protein ACSBL2_03290 [Pedobacter sp. AW31-3R]|uniref:hypothetical protein n=1 Tax=Pedobacter sp. AW31-3R TaxID=3445781 RepID=UPI003F9FBCAC